MAVHGQKRADPQALEATEVRTRITFCNRAALEIPRDLKMAFADYTFSVDAQGKPVDIQKYGIDQFTGNAIPTCIAQWTITGSPAGSGFLVSWKYENSMIVQTTRGSGVTQILNVWDDRPMPASMVRPFDPDAPFCTLGEQTLTTTIPIKLILLLSERPALSMPRALEVAEAFLRTEKIDATTFYMFNSQIEFDVPREERYWSFRWLNTATGPNRDLTVRVSMDGKAELVPGWVRK
jgi:hypothetical protein